MAAGFVLAGEGGGRSDCNGAMGERMEKEDAGVNERAERGEFGVEGCEGGFKGEEGVVEFFNTLLGFISEHSVGLEGESGV